MNTYTYSVTVQVPDGIDAGDPACEMADAFHDFPRARPDWKIGPFVLVKAEQRPHVAAYIPAGTGYLVHCPAGCNLGTSAYQPDESGAQRRVELHKISTAP